MKDASHIPEKQDLQRLKNEINKVDNYYLGKNGLGRNGNSVEDYLKNKNKWDNFSNTIKKNKSYQYNKEKLSDNYKHKNCIDKKCNECEQIKQKSLGMKAYGWSEEYSNNYDNIFRK